MPLKKRKPSAESPEQPPETQFVPQDDDEEAMYEAEAILDEKPFQRLFLVKWVGDDPDTGLPWEPTWEPKSGASQDLIDEWKAKKRTDPTIVGRYVRAEAARKKQQAEEAKELKRQKAQAAQDKKKKRKAESVASGDTPKRARLDTNKPISKTVSTASKGSPQVKGGTKTAKPATRQSSIASPATNKQTVAGPSRAVSDDDTSFEILDDSATFAEPDETFRPDDSLSQPVVTRRQPARAKSKSSEPGLAPRATRKAAATTEPTDGEGPVAEVEPAVDSRKKVREPKTKKAKSAEKDQPAAERDNAVNGTEVQEEPAAGVQDKQPGKTGRKVKLHMGKKQREDGREDGIVAGEDKAPAAVAPSKDAGAEAPSIGNDDAAVVESTSTDKQKASTAPIETGTIASATEKPPAKTPDGKNEATAVKDPAAKDTSQRPHTLMEGAKSPNITMVRPPRLAAVPQPPSAMFRQRLPETQSTEGDKSIPMSQADPIADFSSPSREESSGSARKSRRIDKAPSSQQSPAPSRVAKAEAHGKTASRVVPKMIDGELWITAAETQATHLGGGEENGAEMEVNSAPVVEAAGEDAGPAPPNGSEEDPAGLASPPTEPSEDGHSEADAGVSSNENFVEVMEEFERWKKMAAQNAMDAARKNGTVIDPKIVVEKDDEIAILKKRIEGLEANLVDAGKRSTESSAKEANVAEGNKKLIEQVDEATVRFEKVQKELGEAQAAIAQMSKQHQKADDALRAELAAANARVVEHETALVEVRKVAEDMAQDSAMATALSNDAAIETLRAELATANTAKETLSRKVENMSTDNDFLRQQYQQASNSAVASVRRSAELDERVKKLESQLKVGLKQKDMHYAAIHAKREAEAVKLRASNAFLLEQSRRTDDAIRRKAALYDKYKAEHDLLRQSEQAWADRYAALQERNEDLADQVAALRGRQMGVFDVGGGDLGDSDYSEGDAEDDITDDDERAASSGPIGGFTASQIGAVGGLATQSSEMAGDPCRRSPGEGTRIPYGDDEQMAEGEVEVLIDGGEAFRCLWRRNDGTGCDVVFDHHEDLAHHAKVHAFEVVVKPEL